MAQLTSIPNSGRNTGANGFPASLFLFKVPSRSDYRDSTARSPMDEGILTSLGNWSYGRRRVGASLQACLSVANHLICLERSRKPGST